LIEEDERPDEDSEQKNKPQERDEETDTPTSGSPLMSPMTAMVPPREQSSRPQRLGLLHWRLRHDGTYREQYCCGSNPLRYRSRRTQSPCRVRIHVAWAEEIMAGALFHSGNDTAIPLRCVQPQPAIILIEALGRHKKNPKTTYALGGTEFVASFRFLSRAAGVSGMGCRPARPNAQYLTTRRADSMLRHAGVSVACQVVAPGDPALVWHCTNRQLTTMCGRGRRQFGEPH
jgi:hypothetical protein